MLLPAPPADVFTTGDALRRGVTQRQLEWAVGRGRLHRLRRGVLCPADLWASADVAGRILLLARAFALSRVSPGPFAFSHVTAAGLLGLPVPASAAGRLWITVPSHTRPRRAPDVVQQSAGLPSEDLTTDVARVVERTRWPRAAAADDLLRLLDGRRETPLESRSAVTIHAHGLPPPALQVRVLDERGCFVGRVDFLWLDHGVVGEADGLVKYGEGAQRVVAEERQRQARLQALGLVVVRWTERQLHGDPPLLVEQLRAALAAGNGGRFTGRIA